MNLTKIVRTLKLKGKSLTHVAMSSAPAAKKAKLESTKEQDSESACDTAECEGTGDDSTVPISEGDVGITEYITNNQGFFGILKRRYCDFVVHEIAGDGSVVKLKNYSLPIEVNESELSESDLEQLVGVETWSAIKELVRSEKADDQVTFKAPLEKGIRSKIHLCLRALYPTLESETVEVQQCGNEEDGQQHVKNIVVRHASRKRNSRGTWPRDRGSYCKFVLYKEDKSTMDAVMVLCRLLKVKSSCFSYAGVKDRRAITSQHLTAFKISADRLAALNKRLMNIAVGNFEYVSSGMELGSHSGNHFTIVLRNVSCDDHVISEGVNALANNGFINYFGMQRFGTKSVPTYQIGRCVLHSDWQGAIDLILKPSNGEKEDVRKAKECYWKEGDIAGALALMPKSYYIERALLGGLKKRKPVKDLCGAFKFIPKDIRKIYMHSWQSWCWNKLSSWRLKNLGLAPVLGDLVVRDNEDGVAHITEDDLSSYTISDVVLPIPGHKIKLPNNEVKDEYERVLMEEGTSLEQLERSIMNHGLPGSYRSIVVKPTNVEWHVHHYDDYKVPLILTDLDVMAVRQLPSSDTGDHKAVKIEFTLPSSSYATMAIRELTKMETSSAYQTTLND